MSLQVKQPSLFDLCCDKFIECLNTQSKLESHPLVDNQNDLAFTKAKIYSIFSRSHLVVSTLANDLPWRVFSSLSHPKILIEAQVKNPKERLEDCWQRACQRKFPEVKKIELATWEDTFFSRTLNQNLSIADFRKVPAESWDMVYRSRSRIHTLSFIGNNINDAQLISLGKLFPNIQHLELEDCRSLKGEGIIALIKAHGGTLRSLRLSYAGWQLSEKQIIELLKLCPRLEHLELRFEGIRDFPRDISQPDFLKSLRSLVLENQKVTAGDALVIAQQRSALAITLV